MQQTVGILAIQGGYHAHQTMIESLGHHVQLVKLPEDLDNIDRLVIPGGESTTLALLLKKHGAWEPLKQFCQTHPVFGTCAGSILLAKQITPNADTFGIIDITINRNGYGRQLESFETEITVSLHNRNQRAGTETRPYDTQEIPAIFIRAPIIESVSNNVSVLAQYQNHPVLVQHQKTLACTFHPELTQSTMIHEYFMSL